MMHAIPEHELTNALQNIFGMPVLRLSRRPFACSSSFTMEELDVSTGAGEIRLVVKNVGPDAMLSEAAHLKPQFLYDPLREIQVYSRIEALGNLGAPTFYGSLVDKSGGRYWLFLERIEGPRLWECGELETWLEAARWLARFHSSPSCDSTLARALVPQLLDQNPSFWGTWFERAYSRLGSALQCVADIYADVLDHLNALPRTLIHGEFYPSNILIGQRTDRLRICPVDWEMSATGPGIVDVAALASGNWSRDERLLIARCWYDALPVSLRPPDLITAFDCAQLQLALQWLGWASGWVPPAEHACDWLGEALRIAASDTVVSLAGVPRPSC